MEKRSTRKPEKVTGLVERAAVLEGTASEHAGVVLTTPAGARLRLQRVGGNPFDDAATRELVGRRVQLVGYRMGGVFRYTNASDAPPAEADGAPDAKRSGARKTAGRKVG